MKSTPRVNFTNTYFTKQKFAGTPWLSLKKSSNFTNILPKFLKNLPLFHFVKFVNKNLSNLHAVCQTCAPLAKCCFLILFSRKMWTKLTHNVNFINILHMRFELIFLPKKITKPREKLLNLLSNEKFERKM